jgi:WD40 repeat protein
LLATKSADSTVRFWRTDIWEVIANLEESHSKFAFSGLAFHPTKPTIATLGEKDKIIRVWDVDLTQWF